MELYARSHSRNRRRKTARVEAKKTKEGTKEGETEMVDIGHRLTCPDLDSVLCDHDPNLCSSSLRQTLLSGSEYAEKIRGNNDETKGWGARFTRYFQPLSQDSGFLHPYKRSLNFLPNLMSSSLLNTVLILLITCLTNIPVSYACSSRSTPKPRPPSPTLRPNITIQTYNCPPEYDAHYCLNGATCFTVKIGENILYNCECAEGYMGQRCEFKDLDGSYLPSKQRAMLEQAGVRSAVAIVIILVVIIMGYVYVLNSRRKKVAMQASESRDQVDSFVYERRPFSQYNYNNHNLSISQHVQSPSPSTSQPQPDRSNLISQNIPASNQLPSLPVLPQFPIIPPVHPHPSTKKSKPPDPHL